MEKKPKVSVIIPCYNQGQYVNEAVKSVREQTFQDFEIIIVNDGSTDDFTNDLLRNYHQPKTRVIFTENHGLAEARNKGIHEALGEYILPLDADDKIGEQYMEDAVNILDRNHDIGIVYCLVEYFGKKHGPCEFPEYSLQQILIDNMIICSSFFRRKEWEEVGGYKRNMKHGLEDWDLWLSLIELGKKVYRIPKVLFYYRVTEGSMIKSMTNEHITAMNYQIFLNHKKTYVDNFEYFFEKFIEFKIGVSKKKQSLSEMMCSIEYKIGRFFTAPIHIIKDRKQDYLHYWKLTKSINKTDIKNSLLLIKDYGFANFLRRLQEKILLVAPEKYYREWIRNNEPHERDLADQSIKAFQYEPVISIIVYTFNTPGRFLDEMLESVLSQSYRKWELCIADGGSTEAHVRRTLEEYSQKDNRIRTRFLREKRGIAGSKNEALSLAKGDFIAILGHDDKLSPFALFEVVKTINENDGADFLYSDEDEILENSMARVDPRFKPDWSPDTLLSCNYIGHMAVIKKDIFDQLGGFREVFDMAEDYDLFLRTGSRAQKIVHIPKVLYNRRDSQAYDSKYRQAYSNSAKKSLTDYLSNSDYKADVLNGFSYNTFRISYDIRNTPMVTIIIPTRDMVNILGTCISSILDKTAYSNFNILIINNSSRERETYRYFEQITKNARVTILEYNNPFNFSAINNYAVSNAGSEYILFLNNDVEVINGEWLTAMLEHAHRKEVGAVGAKLYYPDNTVQHGGIVVGLGGVAGHPHRNFARESHGYCGRLKIVQNLSAVTGACLMTRKEVFEEVGGFDTEYSHAYNDVDLCLKIRDKGYLVIWTPYAELYHNEYKSRGNDDTAEKKKRYRREVERFKNKWGHVLKEGDSYYNPNLTIGEDFTIRYTCQKQA